VAAVTPLLVLWPAAGAAVVLSRPGWRRWFGLGYLASYAAAALALLIVQNFKEVVWAENAYAGLTVPVQLAVAARDVAGPIPTESHAEDETALVRAVLAKRLLGRELEFRVEGRVCRVEIALPGIGSPIPAGGAGLEQVTAGPNSVFACR
jgi:hypothetical protein